MSLSRQIIRVTLPLLGLLLLLPGQTRVAAQPARGELPLQPRVIADKTVLSRPVLASHGQLQRVLPAEVASQGAQSSQPPWLPGLLALLFISSLLLFTWQVALGLRASGPVGLLAILHRRLLPAVLGLLILVMGVLFFDLQRDYKGQMAREQRQQQLAREQALGGMNLLGQEGRAAGYHPLHEKRMIIILASFFLAGAGVVLLFRRQEGRIWRELAPLLKELRGTNGELPPLSSYEIREFAAIARGLREASQAQDQALDLVQKQEDRYIQAVHRSPEAMILIDDHVFVESNEAAARMLGYGGREELLDFQLSVIAPPYQPDGSDSVAKAREMVAIAVSRGSNRFIWQHLRGDGSPVSVEITLSHSPVSIVPGRTILQAFLRDLSPQEEAAEKVRLAEERLQSSLAKSKRMNMLMSGREFRILEMKDEVNGLLAEMGRPSRYGGERAEMAALIQEEIEGEGGLAAGREGLC